jgi:SNF2 family DNA or RNA helicase
MKPGVTLYPYQEEGRDFILEHKYVLIGDEMGLGKTIQALAVMDRVDGSILVVCPAMMRATWHKEIVKFTDLVDVAVVSYEGLGKMLPIPDIQMIVFDEAHYLKNTLAKRSQAAHDFVDLHKPEYCVLLTGTPIRNCVGEFYSLLKLLTSVPGVPNGLSIKEKSQYAFNLQYSNAEFEKVFVRGGGTRSVARFSGVRNKMELKMHLKGKYIRRTANKVLSLPPMTSTFVDLSKGRNPDLLLEEAFHDWLDTGKMTKHITHMKMTSAMAKVAYTVPFVRNMVEQGEQVVVFTDHVDPAISLVQGITDKGLCSVGCITGAVDMEDRASLIELFQAGKIQVLVCTIRAAGVGITLTGARICVFNDISWVPADIDQAKKRIHRIGQDKPCMVYHVTQGSFDESIQKTVMAKAKLVKELI